MSSASAKAYDHIRDMILRGRFAPGQRLKEDELTDLCNVSRTPVRDALRRLGTEGLVVILPNQGAHMAMISGDELVEIYALRSMVESHAARRAATRITAAKIEVLKGLADEMEASMADGKAAVKARFPEANGAFHRAILDAADSPRLSAMAGLVIEIPLVLRTLAQFSEQDLRRSMSHHRELIAAFVAQDQDWAAAIMTSHIQAASHSITRAVQDEQC